MGGQRATGIGRRRRGGGGEGRAHVQAFRRGQGWEGVTEGAPQELPQGPFFRLLPNLHKVRDQGE